MNTSTELAPVRRLLLVAILAALSLTLVFASSASAAITHKYLGQITLASGTEPQPSGVDPAGNIIVWLDDQNVIAKYDPAGNPVPFSALGTNIIDGEGGLECPTVPTDCDRVPPGRFGPLYPLNSGQNRKSMVVVDQSNGPAKGYIYMRNHDITSATGEVAVWDSTGKFRGVINEAQVAPNNQNGKGVAHISMAPNGTVYVSRGYSEGIFAAGGMMHVDAFAPIDGNPAHDLFVGQLRAKVFYPIEQVNCGLHYVIGWGEHGAVTSCWGQNPPNHPVGDWRWYSLAEFQKPGNDASLAKDYLPFGTPYSNQHETCTTCAYHYGQVNPVTGNLHLFSRHLPGMVIFDPNGNKVGPTIALNPPEMGGFPNPPRDIAFDNSGGPNHGKWYIKSGANTLSVFSAPVKIPDVIVEEPEVGHDEATLNLEVGKDGGPNITGCEIQYGLTTAYGNTTPCDPAPEYATDTKVSANLSGLFTEADYHYRAKATNANGYNLSTDQMVHTVAVLGVETEAATDISGTSATFNGSLDPDGMPTTYRYQYGIDTNYDLETADANAGAGTGSAPVPPMEVDELQPGKTYHVRLVAENSLGTTFGPDETFTVPTRPLISSLHPRKVLATSATLNARINNFDSTTEYFFEYGVTGTYGQTTPVEELAPSPTDQPVSADIVDLEPGLTYHFRLVATNAHGTSKSSNATFDFSPPSCPNSHVRQQTGSNYLPDCRAYEIVSPGRVGSVQLFPGDLLFRLDESEEGLAEFRNPETKARYQNGGYATNPSRFGYFGSLGGVSGVNSPNFLLDHYVATRTSSGWKTTFPALPGNETAVAWKGQCSNTFHRCLDYRIENSPENEFGRAPFAYLWSVDEKFLGRLPTNHSVVPGADHLTGDEVPSGDFEHFVFSSLDVPFAPGALNSAPGSAYDNAIGPKTVEIISKTQGGEDIPQDAGDADEFIKIEGVSPDGSHILMSTVASGGAKNLYMRVDGAITYEVSAGSPVEMIGMSDDGSTVAFMSQSVLTPEDEDSSRDLYLWEEATDEVRLISVGNGKGNSDSCNAFWTQSCNVMPITPERPDLDDLMAANGGDVYFYSPEQLDADNPGVFNQRNLYHLKNGEVQYVATFDPGTQADRMQISADGRFAAFLTRAELTGYDQTYFDNFSVERTAQEMYLFDSATGEVQCASCDPSGEVPSVLRSDPPANETGETSADVMASKNGPFMSDDGRVAFATADGLVPRDTNDRIDVYQFTEGRPQLISSGTGDREVLPRLAILFVGQNIGLESMSRDGQDIYFSTYETLVPEDENGPFVKFYVAKTNGGFPVLGELFPCEAADECHGETSRPAASPEVGTGTPYSVSGNVEPAQKKKAKKKKKKKKKPLRNKRQRQKKRNG